jgi:hypothetical protein
MSAPRVSGARTSAAFTTGRETNEAWTAYHRSHDVGAILRRGFQHLHAGEGAGLAPDDGCPGARLFDAGEFFEAHEAWEERWRVATDKAEREFGRA